MPRSRLYESSSEGQGVPNHWNRKLLAQSSYSTYRQITTRAPRYPMPLFANAQVPPQWPCTQLGFTTGRLRNTADALVPNRCLQWTEIGN